MKSKILIVLLAATISMTASAAPCDNIVDLDDGAIYQVSNGKAYKMVEIDSAYYTSNEWVPLSNASYVDDYEQSDKAKVINSANASLKRIRAGN